MEVRLGLINKNIARVLQLQVFMPDDNFHPEIFFFFTILKELKDTKKVVLPLSFPHFYMIYKIMRRNGPLFGYFRYSTQYFEIVFISRKSKTQFFDIFN